MQIPVYGRETESANSRPTGTNVLLERIAGRWAVLDQGILDN
jgi:hypothetical protein